MKIILKAKSTSSTPDGIGYARYAVEVTMETPDGWWGTTAGMDAAGCGAILFPRHSWEIEQPKVLSATQKAALAEGAEGIEMLERIGSRIYDDFREGRIDFETCDAALGTLTDLTDGEEWFGIPEEGSRARHTHDGSGNPLPNMTTDECCRAGIALFE